MSLVQGMVAMTCEVMGLGLQADTMGRAEDDTMQVGGLIRQWRQQRRLSQARLAYSAEVSPRHLSCLETGKSRPSRQMLLVLASALDVPLRERNVWLTAAGFAPAYPESDLFSDEHTAVRHAVELVVKHAPYGAIAIDRQWTVLMLDEAWEPFRQALMPRPLRVGDNLLEHTLAMDGLRPLLTNWEDVARATLERLRREAIATGDAGLEALFERLVRLPGVPEDWQIAQPQRAEQLVVPVRLRAHGLDLSLFTTLTTVGTPVDVTLSEIRVESYYPADEASLALMTAMREGTLSF